MKRRLIVILLCILVVVAAVIAAWVFMAKTVTTPDTMDLPLPSEASASPSATPDAAPSIAGKEITIGNNFKLTVPNGWRASVSTQPSFIAVQFARPGQIKSLVYDEKAMPVIDYDGIPSWSGLTEHFYVRAMTSSSQNFNPANHAEVTTGKFTFDDGTGGTKYDITKHSGEAAKWGGLLKDTEWYGRVYVYEKNGARVEAHLAYYPSTKIDETFFEKVARTIRI